MEVYDGTKDPLDHLEAYQAYMLFQGASNEMMCKAFPMTLKGVNGRWFSMLQPGSVGLFAELCKRFVSQFFRGKNRRVLVVYLLILKKKDGKTLRVYMARFNKERLMVDRHDKQVVLLALLGGIWSYSNFMKDLTVNLPSVMS